MIATNVPLFHEMSEMPLTFDPGRLDEAGDIEALRRNMAKYHASCRLILNNTKLGCTRKQLSNVQSESDERQDKHCLISHDSDACLLCDSIVPTSDLQQVMTMNLNNRLHKRATAPNDGTLLAKLSSAYAIMQELSSITNVSLLYTIGKLLTLTSLEKSFCQSQAESDVYPLVLPKLVNYMIETNPSSEGPIIFFLADISQLYTQILGQLQTDSPSVNKTRLKEKLLMEIPELEAHKKGRSILLALQKDVALGLSQASEYLDAFVLPRAAMILRIHILDHQSKVDGTFCEGCIKDGKPANLLQFVGMVEHGADIKSQLGFGSLKSDQATAQLLHYNCFSKQKEQATSHRHSKDRETSFPEYLGMIVYTKTRKRNIIEILHDHGTNISYDRVLQISAQLADATVSK